MGNTRTMRWRSPLLGVVSVSLGACTMVGGVADTGAPPGPERTAVPPRTDSPAPRDGAASSADRLTAEVVEVALASIGSPYEWGGTDANGFDCSGLIQFAYGKLGVRLPRVSRDQIRMGARIDPEPSALRPGDVLGFSTDGSRTTSHVGLYIGDDEFIHSSSSGVRVSTLENSYWQEHLVAARRIVE